MNASHPHSLGELQAFIVRLGAAMNAAGESVHSVQARLTRVAIAYGARSARISAFPTFMLVTMGSAEPTTLEIVSPLTVPRLDQVAALDRLVLQAEQGTIQPAQGLRSLDEIEPCDLVSVRSRASSATPCSRWVSVSC